MPKKKKAKKVTVILLTNPEQIQIGDILFFYDARVHQQPLSVSQQVFKQISHMAMVTDILDGVPIITHATYSANRKAELNKVESTPLRAYTSYYVYRHSDAEIALLAADIAKQCANNNTPYDKGRLDSMNLFLSSVNNLNEALLQNQSAYQDREYLQSWKFLARYRQFQRLIHENSQHGFRCDQLIILCFQIAERQQQEQSKTAYRIQPEQNKWTSLSHYNEELTEQCHASFNPSPIQKLLRESLDASNRGTNDRQRQSLSVSTLFKQPITSLERIRSSSLAYSAKDKSSPAVFLHFLNFGPGGDGGDPQPATDHAFTKIGALIPDANHGKYFPGENRIPCEIVKIRITSFQSQGLRVMTRTDLDNIRSQSHQDGRFMQQAFNAVRARTRLTAQRKRHTKKKKIKNPYAVKKRRLCCSR